jgi:hypothetical protein
MTIRIIIVLLIALLITSISRGQELGLHVTATVGHDTPSSGQVWFGLDATANDSMTDAQWFGGEFLIPSLISPGGVDLRMVNRTLNRFYLSADGYDGGYIDIRHKPAVDSFELQYEMLLSTSDNGDSMHIVWDKSQIPAKVRHIYISSEALSLDYIRLDMTKRSSLDFAMQIDSINLYHQILITLLYNQDKLGVANTENIGRSQSAIIYPSVASSNSPLYISMKEECAAKISVFDITGRTMRSYLIDLSEGTNQLPPLQLPAGIYVAEIRDNNRNILLCREKLIVQ